MTWNWLGKKKSVKDNLKLFFYVGNKILFEIIITLASAFQNVLYIYWRNNIIISNLSLTNILI